MASDIRITQTGPLTFEVHSSAKGAKKLIKNALSRIEPVMLGEADSSEISGLYQFGGGVLISFSVYVAESAENLTLVELEIRGNEPEKYRSRVQMGIGEALVSTYDPDASQSAGKKGARSIVMEANRLREKQTARSSPNQSSGSSYDYTATNILGFILSTFGWIGVAATIIGTIMAASMFGWVVALAVGFTALLFCLITVSAGELLCAQAAVANNSRLILMHLERLAQSRE